jgi:hypothetical protein
MLVNLVHPFDELIDVVLTVTGVTTLNVVVSLLLQASQRRLQLEGPEEVVGLLEVGANSHDLMDKILNADDVVLAQALISTQKRQLSIRLYNKVATEPKQKELKMAHLLDNLVVGQRNPLLVQLSVAPLVDQLPDALQVRVPKENKVLPGSVNSLVTHVGSSR